jgi:hypothetical protein
LAEGLLARLKAAGEAAAIIGEMTAGPVQLRVKG